MGTALTSPSQMCRGYHTITGRNVTVPCVCGATMMVYIDMNWEVKLVECPICRKRFQLEVGTIISNSANSEV